MRILLLRKRGEWAYGSPLYFHEFEQELGKHADCIHAGPDWPLYRESETVDQTVKRIYGDNPPDWVIDRERIEKLDQNRQYMVGHHLTDLHGRISSGIRNSPKLLKLINSIGYDAVFMKTPYIYNNKVPPSYFVDHLKPSWYFLPYSIDPKKFYPRFPKEHDVTLIGSVAARYPVRKAAWEELPDFCHQYGFKCLMNNKGPRPSWEAAKWENDSRYYIRDRYAEALGKSRFFIFCGGIYGYPVQKYFEVPASGCLPLAERLRGWGKTLGFIDGETYVAVDKRSWKEKILYYNKNYAEASKIIEKGRKLVLKRHTHQLRVREFLEILERFL
jgi:hypothetical protein